MWRREAIANWVIMIWPLVLGTVNILLPVIIPRVFDSQAAFALATLWLTLGL